MSTSRTWSIESVQTWRKAAWRAGAVGWVLAASTGCFSSPEEDDEDSFETLSQTAIVGARYQAENWASDGTTPGGVFNEGGGEGLSVAGFQVNEQIKYASVRLDGADQIRFNIGAPYGGGRAEIWADAVGTGGTRLGTIELTAATGSTWNSFVVKTATITKLSGTHNLFLKGVATGGDWLFKIDWFEVHSSTGGGTDGGTPPPGGVPIRVTNKCPFGLHVAATDHLMKGLEQDAQGNTIYRYLTQGQVYTYTAPSVFPGGRVSAYKAIPSPASPRELEKAEFTFEKTGTGVQVFHYNVTYVDHLGLPIEVSPTGSGSGCVRVGCYQSASTIQTAIRNECPDGLRYTMGGDTICLAPRSFCLDGEYASDPRRASICTRLDSEIARCASMYPGQCNPGTAKTAQVYACSPPFFDQSAKWCAALNRSMLDNPDSTNVASYYNTGRPHNAYAKWIHQKCGAVYAFAYDDYPSAANQAGLYRCDGGTQLNVTFCPNG